MQNREEALAAFGRLLDIMDELREKCPWDKEQTMESIRHLSLEEVFELSEAILSGDKNEIRQELGDIMLHIVFYSKIASETNDFTIVEVLNGICEKLIRRHPHIYGTVEAGTADIVKENWEQIKLSEGKKSVLQGVPSGLPALLKALRIQDKVSNVGFDWENTAQVWEKFKEESAEFEAEVASHNQELMEAEFGDLLFSLVNVSRFLKINPEDALEKTNRKFIRRFVYLEEKAKLSGKSLKEMTLAEMDVFWEEAKSLESDQVS